MSTFINVCIVLRFYCVLSLYRNLNDHQNKDGLQHNIQTQAGCEESHFQQNLPAAVVPVKKGLPGALAGFGNLLSLKSFRAVFTRAKVPSGKRRNPSVAKPVDFGQTNEEEKLAASYNRKREIDGNAHVAYFIVCYRELIRTISLFSPFRCFNYKNS